MAIVRRLTGVAVPGFISRASLLLVITTHLAYLGGKSPQDVAAYGLGWTPILPLVLAAPAFLNPISLLTVERSADTGRGASMHGWGSRQGHWGLPVMVAFPVAYDAMWVQWYMHRFVGDDPFRRRAIIIKTLAMVAMGAGYRATAKSSLPKHWRPPARHTHVAVEDAIEQGELFMNIVRELNAQRGDIAPPSSRETEPHRVFARLIRLNHFAVTGWENGIGAILAASATPPPLGV